MDNKIWRSYSKVNKIIESCKTLDQLRIAEKVFEQWMKYYNVQKFELHSNYRAYPNPMVTETANLIRQKELELISEEFENELD